MDKLLERIKDVIKYANKSESAFAKELGIGQSTFNTWMTGKCTIPSHLLINILENYREISAEWLLRGIGVMTKGVAAPTSNFNELVPVVPKSLVRAAFKDVYDDVENINGIEHQPMLPVFGRYNMVSEVYSNAMAPYVQQGSMVALRKIKPENVMNGDMRVVDIKNKGMVLRFVDVETINGKLYYTLRAAQKDRYTPMQLPVDDTYSISAVVGQFTIYNR